MPLDSKALDFFISQYPDFAPTRNDGQLIIIFDTAQRIDLFPGMRIYEDGKPVDKVYLLESGSVNEQQHVKDIRTGPRTVTRLRTAGKFLGLYDLIYRRPHSTSAVVVEEGAAYALPSEEFFRLLYHFPKLRQALIPFDLLNRLRTIPFLAEMSPTILGFLAETAEYIEVEEKTPLYARDLPAEYVYVIDIGQMRLIYEDGTERWIGNSQPFGLLDTRANIFGGYDLDHTAVSICFTKVFSWERQQFSTITGVTPERIAHELYEETSSTLKNLSLFSGYEEKEQERLLGYISHYHYPQPDLLLQQGEFADSLWILMPQRKAMMYALVGGVMQQSGVTGTAYFNEAVLRAQVACTSTLQAEAGSQWLRLHVEDFRQFINNEAQNNEAKRKELWAKLKIPDNFNVELAKAPPNFDFPLLPGEVVESLERRHWVIFIRKIVLPLLLFGITVIFWSSVMLFGAATLWIDMPVLALLAVAGLWMLWGYVDYYNDYFLVTNMRVAQVEKVVFFSESRVTALLDQVRTVTIQQNTFWQTFWKYGTIFVQTAGRSAIVFDFLRSPDLVAKKINQLSARRNEHYQASGKREIFNALERQLGLVLDTPDRTWHMAPAKKASAPRSWWQFFFNRQARAQFLTEQRADRVVWRKHWITLIGMTSMPVFFALLSGAATTGLLIYYIAGATLRYAIGAIPIGLFSMFCWTWLWWKVQDWYNDTYEVTDLEIIDTEMRPILFPFYFDKKVRRAELKDINDISYVVPGPLNYLLNMGNVYAETAAQGGRFAFEYIKNPQSVADEIRRRVEQYHERMRTMENRRRIQEFPVWFEMYERLGKEREKEMF